LFWEKVPFFALSIVSSVVTLVAQGSGGAISSLDAIPAKSRIANAVVSYVQYIGKMIWPHTLAVLYPHPGHTLATWEVAGTSALLVCISGLAIFVRRRYPYVLMGWLWYIGTLIPVIGLVQVGLQATADRYTYVPLLGIFIIFAWGLGDIESSWRYGRTAFRTGTLALLLALSLSARSQLHSWQNSFRLFEHTLQVTSRNYVAHTVLASALASAGKLDEAIIQLKEALNIEPRYAGAHKSLGTVLAAKGRVHEALVHYAEALLNKPGDVETHYNLATVLDANGRVDEAIVHYVEALRIAPSYTEAHYNLARVLASRGKLNEAVGHYHEVLRSNPYHAGAHVHLAVALERQSKIPEAIEHYQRALLLKPDWPEAMNNLAWIFATEADPKIRNAAKALELAQKACRLKDNKDVQLMDTLAAAYAEATQFQEAIETAQRAQELALAKGQQDLADVIEQRIRQYKAHKPYHEKAMTDAHPSTEPHGADTAPPEFHGSANQERPHLALSCV
jgi:tetratricopeptide (TPR) repeat protein